MWYTRKVWLQKQLSSCFLAHVIHFSYSLNMHMQSVSTCASVCTFYPLQMSCWTGSTDSSPLLQSLLCDVTCHSTAWCLPGVLVCWVSGFRSRPNPAQTPKPSNSDVSSLLPPSLFSSCHFPLTVPPQPFPFCSSCTLPLFLLFTSSSPLHPLFAPLCPTAVSVTGALDSVVVSALWLNLRLLGGTGPPVALQGRHSVPAHYRHNLLLSPVSKPRRPTQRKTQR